MTWIAIRADASAAFGTGHLRRCLSLAHALAEQGAQVCFVSRRLDGVGAQVLLAQPFEVHWLEMPLLPASCTETDASLPPHSAFAGVGWVQDARETVATIAGIHLDWLVVDHYAFDARWHQAVRDALGCRLVVIDDTADRLLSADVLLDHNWADDHREKYAHCLAHEPRWLTGPQFALLDAAYRDAVRYQFSSRVRSLGIFMGGTDLGGMSAQILAICREQVGFAGLIEVVSTSANPHLSLLRAECARWPNTSLTLDLPDLAGFFARHDLQIGAGGGATWERCCIGVPTIGVAVASNQLAVIPGLQRLGAIRSARLPGTDPCRDPAPPLAQVLTELLTDSVVRERLGRATAKLVDGRGAQRVSLALLRDALMLRSATPEDASCLYGWRNHPAVRAVSGQTAAIDWSTHVDWLRRTLSAPDRWLFVAHVGNLPVGSIRFDRLGENLLEVSLYLDPGVQGLGLGSRMLLAGEQAMLDRLGEPFTAEATVIEGNASSRRMFERCHYLGESSVLHKRISPCTFISSDCP